MFPKHKSLEQMNYCACDPELDIVKSKLQTYTIHQGAYNKYTKPVASQSQY